MGLRRIIGLRGALGLFAMLAGCAAPAARGPGPVAAPFASPPAPPYASAPFVAAPRAALVPSAAAPEPSAAVAQPGAIEMKPPVTTALATDIEALGLNPKSLPPLEKLDPRALRGVMKLMAKSLGVKCGDCHAEGDFAALTRRKKIAGHMWNEFAAKLSMVGGGPLFCDSCHQGRTTLLDRSDKKALGAWMDENFVIKLERKDDQPHECETCHVDMEMKLLAKWAGPLAAR